MAVPSIVRSLTQYENLGTATRTISVNSSSGDMVVVFVGWRRNDPPNQNLTSHTYNGVAMTAAFNDVSTLTGEGIAALWIRPGTTGTFNVVLTWDTAVDSVNVQAIILTGSASTSTVPSSAIAADSSSASAVTANVTGGTDRLILGCALIRGGDALTITDGAGQTLIAQDLGNEGTDNGIISSRSSYEVGTGTVTHSYTYAPTATYNGGVAVLAIEGTAGGGSVKRNNLVLMGMGR